MMRQFASLIFALVHCCFLATTALADGAKTDSAVDWYSPCYDGKTLRFSSGFEDETQARPNGVGQNADLQRSYSNTPCGIGEGTKATKNSHPGNVTIQFEGGSESDRQASVITDPNNSVNHVLKFWLQKPYFLGTKNFPVKGRIQLNVYGIHGIHQLRLSERMYLHPDFNFVRSYPGMIDWLTISEWWNNASWRAGEKYPFRITVSLIKETADTNAPLLFKVSAQAFDTSVKRWNQEVWSKVNRDVIVPIGQWMSLDYGFIEGNADTGRFFLTATFKDGNRVVIFDQKGFTHHPDDLNPDGLSEFNPMKLYTSSRVIDHVRSKGGALQILWDDFQLTACRAQDGAQVNSCAF